MELYKSFEEILKNNESLENLFKEQPEYFAHTRFLKNSETLYEHIIKVKKYFLRIIELNNLEPIINHLINKISIDNVGVGNYLKTLFYQVILFHDFGKVNPNFQAQRMENDKFQKDNTIKIGYEHSFLSAYFFLNYSINTIPNNVSKESRSFLYTFSFLFSIPVLKHHSGFIEKDYKFSSEKINSIHKLLSDFDFTITKEQVTKLINYESSENDKNLWAVFNEIAGKNNIDYFALFTLLKLNYSLLTASDYYATSDYMNDLQFNTETDFGLLTEELKNKINSYFTDNEKATYNKQLVENTDFFLNYSFENLQEKSNENLNILRQKLGAEVLTNIEKHRDKHIFYIEAPTGGGKTNMSMIAVYKMLQMHSEINKIFYVFPFTTLITQTSKAIKDTLGLSENEVAEVHSKAGFKTKNHNEEDAKYGNEKRNQIDNLFVNYPLTLLTHIKFFDILKSNRKDTNYILHRLANSIVIIDELQAYSPEHWDKIKFYIAKYAEYFDIRFIIMSATLPKIDKIKMAFDTHFEPLIDDAKKYLQNPNFAERVAIKINLLKKKKIDLEELSDILLEKSKKYTHNRTDKYKGSVYTIIEFIFKKSASLFYDIIIKKHDDFFDEILVLSGTIIEARRKYIIEYLKDENNRKKKILLITTQVVEAGVDIDMDLGFKNQSLIDSDEQLAGRINRNVKKKNCELWLFRADTAKPIYGKDLRYDVTANFNADYVYEILTKKNFDALYKKVFEEIDKLNASGYKTNFNTYKTNFENINFRKINEDFKLIDSQNISVFVPADIDIHCYGSENNFSESEIKFIKDNNCLQNEYRVSGEKIWNLYISLIQNKEKRFSQDIKILNGIMSKFVFSVFLKTADKLKEFCEYNEDFEDFKYFQYLKLRKEEIHQSDETDKVYSLESGINENKFDQSFEII